jgi:Outer membrane protein beta-barrel domain
MQCIFRLLNLNPDEMKTIKILFLLSLALPATMYGQDLGSSLLKKTRIGIVLSPDYCYRVLKADNSEMGNSFLITRNRAEESKFGNSAGLTASTILGTRISVETGIVFSDKGYRNKTTDIIPNDPEPDVPVSYSSVDHYFYLDVPAKADYYLLTGRLKMFLSAGLIADFYLEHKVKTTFNYVDGNSKKYSSKQDYTHSFVILSAVGGIGLEYNLSDRLGFRFEPEYRRFLQPVFNTPIRAYLYSFGINTGVYYQI